MWERRSMWTGASALIAGGIFLATPAGLTSQEAVATAITTTAGIPQADDADRVTPRQVLWRGLVGPGVGHFYLGDHRTGSIYAAAAAAILVAGLSHDRVHTTCTSPLAGDACPSGSVYSRTSDRPRLGSALIGVAGIIVAGAVHAYRTADRADAPFGDEDPPLAARTTIRFQPALLDWSEDRARIGLLSIRF